MATKAVTRIATLNDPRERAKRAADAMRRNDSENTALRDVRDAAMKELIKAGEKPAEVARIVGTSRALVSKMFPPGG